MAKNFKPRNARPSQGGSFADILHAAGALSDDKYEKNKAEKETEIKEAEKQLATRTVQQLRNNGNGGGRGRQPRERRVNQNNQHLVHNPYNFVPLTDHVITAPELVKHDEISEELLSGKIEYSVVSKSPIFVGDKDGCFHKDEYGCYSIPGSTMRGLVRSNLQILGHACTSGDIDDYSLMYRDITGDDRYKDVLGARTIPVANGKTMSVLDKVSAGYIECKNNEYFIHPNIIEKISDRQGKMNYYEINERIIINNYIDHNKQSRFSYLIEKMPLQHLPDRKFTKDETNPRHIKWRGHANASFKPYYAEISYEIDANIPDRVVAVDTKGKLKNNGYMIITGPMQMKKAIYIIPRIDLDQHALKIEDDDLKAFRIDFERKENQVKQYGEDKKDTSFFNLPKEGETKPVFYINIGNKLYFGFTPRLRIFYDYTIRDGVSAKQKEAEKKLDLAKSIMGYTTDDGGNFKSKIAFLEAALIGSPKNANQAKCVLAGPKPTSYLDYLVQNDILKDYNSNSFKLRGTKQYWLKSDLEVAADDVKDSVASEFTPLEAGSRFEGKVVFKNLTTLELGLLLWSIQLDKGSDQNMGKGRPYGYGRLKITVDGLKIEDLSKAYSRDGFSTDVYKECDDEVSEVNTYIERYIDYLSTELGVSNIRKEDESIGTLLLMKDSAKILPNSETGYMHIDKRQGEDKSEYQSRKANLESLATPQELMKRNQN